MTVLLLGLVVFLGVHSTRIVADSWRRNAIARIGEGKWKAAYSAASIAGIVLVVWGYGLARQQPVALWTPPLWTRHAAAVLMLVSMVLLVAAYVPGNALKARLGHPMLLAVKTWAFAHLLSNGTLADVALFGGFLLWAVLCFRAARQRDRVERTPAPAVVRGRTATSIGVGVLAWVVFTFWAHRILIGVPPLD